MTAILFTADATGKGIGYLRQCLAKLGKNTTTALDNIADTTRSNLTAVEKNGECRNAATSDSIRRKA